MVTQLEQAQNNVPSPEASEAEGSMDEESLFEPSFSSGSESDYIFILQ